MKDRKNGPWTIHDTTLDFQNPWIGIERSRITHPDGSAGTYGVVRYTNVACGVLPIDSDGYTWLVGQHRFPLDDYSWELPEGGGAKTDDPLKATARELKEETGLVASSYMPLGRWHLSNSVSDEVAFGFLAWDLEEGEASPDPSEDLQVKRVPIGELVAQVRSGDITDAFTHLMVMSAIDMAHTGQLPDEIANWLKRT